MVEESYSSDRIKRYDCKLSLFNYGFTNIHLKSNINKYIGNSFQIEQTHERLLL